MCCSCCGNSRQTKILVGVNITYFIFGFLYLICGTFGSILTADGKLPVANNGNISCAIILMILSLFGIFVTCRRSKFFLSIYFCLLAILCVAQLSISIYCFSVTRETEEKLMEDAWKDCDENLWEYIWETEEVFLCCGFDDNDYRRDFTNRDNRTKLERFICIDRVEDCAGSVTTTSKYLDETLNYLNIETTTEFLDIDIPTLSPDDLVCGTCKEELVNQTHRIYNFQGGIALVVAFLEMLPIYLAYRQWKYVSSTEEEIALNNF